MNGHLLGEPADPPECTYQPEPAPSDPEELRLAIAKRRRDGLAYHANCISVNALSGGATRMTVVMAIPMTSMRSCHALSIIATCVHDSPVPLLGISTDAGNPSPTVARAIMSGTCAELFYIGIPGLPFWAPLLRDGPFCFVLDTQHICRACTRALLRADLKLGLSQVSLNHLQVLLRDSNCDVHLRWSDLILPKARQNYDSDEKIYHVDVAEKLDAAVPGASATAFILRALSLIFEPLLHRGAVPSFDLVSRLWEGLTCLRLWRAGVASASNFLPTVTFQNVVLLVTGHFLIHMAGALMHVCDRVLPPESLLLCAGPRRSAQGI